MTQALKPPPTLACCRVVEYAILAESVRYSGHSNLFRGNDEVGPVPCLAICHSVKESRFLLFHCGKDWTIQGCESHMSLAKAKTSAERAYPGVSAVWVDPAFTEQDATAHLNEIWSEQRCVFCGRIPPDFEKPMFIQRNHSSICHDCVKTCYELLQSDEDEKEHSSWVRWTP